MQSKNLEKHCRQHYIKFFCKCGWQSSTKDCVTRHQRRLDYAVEHGQTCYEVDVDSFPRLTADMRWSPAPVFRACVPHSKPEERSRELPPLVEALYHPTAREDTTGMQHRLGRIQKRVRQHSPPPHMAVQPPVRVQGVEAQNNDVPRTPNTMREVREQISRLETELYYLRRRLRQMEQDEEDAHFRRRYSHRH